MIKCQAPTVFGPTVVITKLEIQSISGGGEKHFIHFAHPYEFNFVSSKIGRYNFEI